MLVSIVIPVAKEGEDLYDRICSFDDNLKTIFTKHGFKYEILLVSDVYHPPTIKAMVKLANQGIARSLLLTKRIGKGGSIKNAIPYTKGDLIALLDADIPITVETLTKAITFMITENIDLLIANRTHRTHSLTRRTLSTAYNNLVRLLFRTGLKDHQAGFKILTKKAAITILTKRTRTDGLAYDTEIIVWAKKHGYKYQTINVTWKEQRKSSTIPPIRAILTMLADLIMLRLLTLGKKYVALQHLTIGNIIELSSTHTIGQEFMTVIEASGPKKHLLNILRKAYITIAFKK